MKFILLSLAAAALMAQKVNPSLLSKVEPQFSDEARQAKWPGGEVKAKILINEKGEVESVTVIEHPGYKIDQMTIAALKQWKFKPATQDGKPVKNESAVTVNFKRW